MRYILLWLQNLGPEDKEATDVSWVLTFLCSSGYAYNISDIWGQLGKKRNPNSLPNPATDDKMIQNNKFPQMARH